MVTLNLPPDEFSPSKIPSQIVYLVSINLSNFNDLLNFSLINKSVYNDVMNNNDIWIYYLKCINYWKAPKPLRSHNRRKSSLISPAETAIDISNPTNNTIISSSIDDALSPINCLLSPINDPDAAKLTFINIYKILTPIISDLLINNYSNFQNLSVFKQFNNSYDQSLLFSNIYQFLPLFKSRKDYQSLLIRLNTILDIFINSIIKELEVNLDSKNYLEAYKLILSLNNLTTDIQLNSVNIDPLESLLEFFITRYVDDYVFLASDDLIGEFFERVKAKKDDKGQLVSNDRGVVRGYKFRFDKAQSLFNERISNLINTELEEINLIFQNSQKINKSLMKKKNSGIDEIPIILKILETFLNSYLIGGLVDKLIRRAKDIDQGENIPEDLMNAFTIDSEEEGEDEEGKEEEEEEEQEEEESETANDVGEDIGGENVWGEDPSSPKEEKEEVKQASNTELENIDNQDKFKEINLMNENSMFFQAVPFLNYMLIKTFSNLNYPNTTILSSGNKLKHEPKSESSMDYVKITCELIHFYYEPYLLEFSELLPKQCHYSLLQLISQWETKQLKIQNDRKQNILDLIDPNDLDEHTKKNLFTPLDIFSGFSNIFKKKGKDSNKNNNPIEDIHTEGTTKLSKLAANLQILADNVETMKSLISMDLIVSILQHVKNSYDLLLNLTDLSTKELSKKIHETCEKIFIDTLSIILSKHVEPGFEEALTRLKNYNPIEYNTKHDNETLEPLQNFIELVNIGDLSLQMVNIFYQNELVENGIIKSNSINNANKYDFLSSNKCDKIIKKFENMLDKYVANGLDISIGVIINEINYCIVTCDLNDKTYDLPDDGNIELLGRPSEYVVKIINILETHFNLLNGSIDKSILDVFKEEICERFVNSILIKLILRRFVISVSGGLQFISDINRFYKFSIKNKIKPSVLYFTGLKKISQLYIIDCSTKEGSKSLGKLVVDVGRDNGVFTPEEVYQFVTRRKDWVLIKSQIDKIMYGFGMTDCVIM